MEFDERFFLYEGERELPELVVSIPDALPRLLPAYSYGVQIGKTSLERFAQKKSNYYGQHHGGSNLGSIRIYVNIDEYFNLFREMVIDNSAILRFKYKFTKGFLENVVNNVSLESPEDRIKLIRQVFGVRDHDDWHIAYECPDDELKKWFDENVLKSYTNISTKRWVNLVGYIYVPFIRDGIMAIQFDGAGTHSEAKCDFPNGGNLDLLHFNEMKRIADVLRENPFVSYFEIRPGVGTIIRPFFKR